MTLAERARIAELPDHALLTPAEAAAWLGLDSPRHLVRLGVPSLRLGHRTTRYRKGTVQSWLDSKAEQGSGVRTTSREAS